MKNITHLFDTLYVPRQAIVMYELKGASENSYYAELFGLDEQGKPLAPHPLSLSEAKTLSQALLGGRDKRTAFLHSDGLLPKNLLYLDHYPEPTAIWYTPARTAPLLFTPSLSIPSGNAAVPPLIWKATKSQIWMFVLKDSHRPTLETKLYQAPFFNVRENGSICMGNVHVSFAIDSSVQHFIASWEQYFFGSYFTHMIAGQSPTKGNIVALWKSLVGKETPFPLDQLKPTTLTLQKILP